ncbi:conserved hypothetical protein [Theileria equi strain WA]|uniref:Uncharacterized protein n=1 Tax=Theileria equi strain WA TaxID=1537102 RepID=L1LF14_THEEQ|nr:conserved hypothetical protein [Theileria equi strain WA]EKX73825.1 conserved hypothetical protein [Theileria equi strain WA]|eukprot:XP_004833277.1 conserved hypothetical protein [Theileria equi strain WA]
MSAESLFKFLVSYSQVTNTRIYLADEERTDGLVTESAANDNYGNIKISSWRICERLFSQLNRSGFVISSETAPHVISSYMRLCVGYGQKSEGFNEMYHRTIDDIVQENVEITEGLLDELLLLYDRLGIFDKRFAVYYSNRISKNFNLYTENQIGNFCRYMTKLPFIKTKPSSMEWVKNGSYYREFKGGNKSLGVKGKRLPRYYRKMLLDRRSDAFTTRVDYSSSISASIQSRVLSDWDFGSSAFIKCLEKELLYVLHEYTYFNLVDVGEMFFVYGINSSLMPRFSTELSKYLYILKYGYPIKALVVSFMNGILLRISKSNYVCGCNC